MKKPIRVFYSLLGERFYASNQYRINKNGTVTITGDKTDVTNDIAAIVINHEITFIKK
jgi:hypothetical protein